MYFINTLYIQSIYIRYAFALPTYIEVVFISYYEKYSKSIGNS